VKVDENVINLLKQQESVTIGFSCGKDSLCCALILKELGVNFTPFFFYHVPEIEFVNKQIEMYENLLDIKIIQLPHPMLYDTIRHQDYQPKKTADYLVNIDYPKMTFEGLMDIYFDSIGKECPKYDIVGMRAAESFNRREFFKKHGAVNEKKRKIYPIYNWNKAQTVEFVKSKNIPLTNDYEIWNRSWDGIKYQFLYGVKKNYPNDYETIKQYFPLIDLELKRYEFNLEYHK
jgi:3'-phosphoadenosine 5'-phosphosulfate sulfotransferase (PAPS reductase)/FAD synthetase